MGAEWRTGSMSAWLLKKKSGSSMVRVRQYNKRYFTIDFDSHVFFYSHAEGSKKVSSVIRFADIVDVVLPDPTPDRPSESRGSMLRRSFSFGSDAGKKSGEQAHFFVTVVVRPSKTMELLCSSSTEATQWFQAFQEAMLFGKDDGEEAGMNYVATLSSAEEEETDESRSAVDKVAPPAGKSLANAPVASNGGYPVASSGENPTLAGGYPTPIPAAQPVAASNTTAATPLLAARADPPEEVQPEEPAEAATAASVETLTQKPARAADLEPAADTAEAAAAPDAQAKLEPVAPLFGKAAHEAAATAADDNDDEKEPPKTKGTFLDFSVDAGPAEEIGGSAEAGASGAGKDGASAKPAAMDEIIETKGQIMQASDFGFGADEDTESSGSAISTPRLGDKSAFAGPSGLASLPELDDGSPAAGKTSAGKESDGATPSRSSPGAEGGARSYGDRHEGLSMQERLANLEFSDCEDDDDDPLGLGTAKG